jgi:long-chain acyl-CoA synthetase
MTLQDFLQFHRYPRRIAVIESSAFRRRKFSYQEMQSGVDRIASSFTRLGIKEGDRVILWGENSARWMMTFYACLQMKIVVVPIDSSFSADFVAKIRGITEAKLVCSDAQGGAWNELLKTDPGSRLPEVSYSPAKESQLLEIIFTSGTTGEPKGVMITHGNLLANLVPIYDEYRKYKKYAKPFSPLRFIHLIPLSHLFGQVMALFIPQMLFGTVIYTPLAAPQIAQETKQNSVSVITCVPQELSLLRKYVIKKHSIGKENPPQKSSPFLTVLSRWWKYRAVHREFGWKFWAFILGGATLPLEEEEFWRNLGYAVIQGYGMTETAPSITITHPFKGMKSGSVGKKLPGLEIQIAEDGEILVRGPHVSPGYYKNQSATEEVFKEGWLYTGDLGKFDEQGNLQLLGRKKEVIVTSEGLNVYPDDVERILNQHPEVSESAVVPKQSGTRSVVHAVLVLKEGSSPAETEKIIQETNRKLESFQRIQSFSLWPHPELPRTSTGKLKRLSVGLESDSEAATLQETTEDLARQLLSGVTAEKDMNQDLGLSSLDRVELLMELESAGGAPIDEAAFAQAKTLSDVKRVIETSADEQTGIRHYPSWKWPRWFPIRIVRYVGWHTLAFPAMHLRMNVQVSGLENLRPLRPPVFFVCNHQSVLDAPAILKALPTFRWRRSLAPAMGARRKRIDHYLTGLFFNTYLLPGTSVGLRKAIELTGELVDQGYSPLVFPEGERTPDGKLRPFRPGIGVLVNHTKLPVVPILIDGAYSIWPVHARGPKQKGIVRVHFEKPIDFSGKSPAQITAELEVLYKQRLRESAD